MNVIKSKKLFLYLYTIMVMIMFATSFTEIKPNALFSDIKIDNNTGSVTTTTNGNKKAFNKIITKYKALITFVSGIAAVTMVAIFIFNFTKLGSTATNPAERQKVLVGLIWSGLAAAGLGSVSLIVGVFYGMLGD